MSAFALVLIGAASAVAAVAGLFALGAKISFTGDGRSVQPRAGAWTDESKRKSWAARYGA